MQGTDLRKVLIGFVVGLALAALGMAVAYAADGDDGATGEPQAEEPVDEGPFVDGISQAELQNPDAPLPTAPAEKFEEPNRIPAGYDAPDELIESCERIVAGNPTKTDPSFDATECGAILKFEAGELQPGEYSNEELEAAVHGEEGQ